MIYGSAQGALLILIVALILIFTYEEADQKYSNGSYKIKKKKVQPLHAEEACPSGFLGT